MATPVELLIQELTEASRLYYQTLEESPLSDEAFDKKVEELRSYQKTHPHLFTPGTPGALLLEGAPGLGTAPQGKKLITHSTPMLSLGKADDEDTLLAWLAKMQEAGAEDYRIQAKLDGLALTVTYQDGHLTTIATRGNGIVGDDSTYLAHAPHLTVVGLPLTLPRQGTIEVRGEIYLTQAQYEDASRKREEEGLPPYKHPRNAATGLMKKAKLGLTYPVELTFTTYTYLQEGVLQDLTQAPPGFLTVDQVTQEQLRESNSAGRLTGFTTPEEVFEAVELFGLARKKFTIPTDGAVVKATNESFLASRMGATSHHPNSQLAYKYPGDVEETTVLSWTITVGKTGKVTPVAVTTPVYVGGGELSHFSCHNYNWISKRQVTTGSRVAVTRRHEVIPQVVAVVSNPPTATPLPVPTTCPSCSTPLEGKANADGTPPNTLTCPNLACPSRNYFLLTTAVKKPYLNIDRLGEACLKPLWEAGRVTTIADLYSLTLKELSEAANGTTKEGTVKKLGETTAKHILSYIEASKDLPLTRLLPALGVPQLGPSTAKLLLKVYPTIEALQEATVEEVAALKGFDTTKATAIVAGLTHQAPLIKRMQEAGVKFPPAEGKKGKLTGLSFAISGEVPEPFAHRQAWVAYLEEEGATFDSTPKAETTFMVADPTATSSKVKKVHSLQTKGSTITFLSPEEFTRRYS